MKRWVFVGTMFAFVATWSSLSAAEPAVIASTLFQQAVVKMEAEQFSEACPLLEESYKLDAKPGTLFTLANCRDREGKVASASARYGEYVRAHARMNEADQQKHGERAAMAEARMRELEPQVPALKLTWQNELPAQVKIRVDDVEWAGRTPNLPLPLDPGPHEIIVSQPGAPDTKRVVTLELGKPTTFDLDSEITFVKPPVEKPTSISPSVQSVPSMKPGTNHRKIGGFVTLGLGGAGLVFGGVMGMLALTEKQTVGEHCHGAAGYDCDATGMSAVANMRNYATPSTAGFIAGGVLAATGLVLVVTMPKQSKEKPMTMTLGAGGVQGGGVVGVEGKF